MPSLRITPHARRILLVCLLSALAAMYGFAWFSPAIGLEYSDGAALVQAVTHHIDASPPLFPALLGLFAMVSRQPQWLKLLPLLCTLGWLVLTQRLLVKMGASLTASRVLVLLTAASPTVVHLATGIFAEPLFALLVTASLLALLEEQPVISGLCAGLATVTVTAGTALILASIVTLAAHRRLRSALIFTASAMLFATPWLGWWLANGGLPASRLHANELAVLAGNNLVLLAAAPVTMLSGYVNLYPGLLTAVALLIVLVRRRLFVPDLFFGLYCVALLFRTEPPLRGFAPVLPMFLWMLWRVARTGKYATVTKVTATALLAPALWFGFTMLARPTGWHEMETLFAYIRGNTAPDAVLMADLDPVFTFNTGRRTVRGFVADSYRSYYAPAGAGPVVTPDELRASVIRERVRFVVVTPDRELPESASFHKAVGALERSGMLEPVEVPGVPAEYRLLRVR